MEFEPRKDDSQDLSEWDIETYGFPTLGNQWELIVVGPPQEGWTAEDYEWVRDVLSQKAKKLVVI